MKNPYKLGTRVQVMPPAFPKLIVRYSCMAALCGSRADRKCKSIFAPAPRERAPGSIPAPSAGSHASPGVCTRASRRAAAPCGGPRSTGWGGAALLPLGLDTRRRTGYGRSARATRGKRPGKSHDWTSAVTRAMWGASQRHPLAARDRVFSKDRYSHAQDKGQKRFNIKRVPNRRHRPNNPGNSPRYVLFRASRLRSTRDKRRHTRNPPAAISAR